jgi:hypothetical protein
MKEKHSTILTEAIDCCKSVTPEKFGEQAKKKAPGLLITIAGQCAVFTINCFKDAAKEIADAK